MSSSASTGTDIALDPAGVWVVEVDQGRIGPQVVEPAPDGVRRHPSRSAASATAGIRVP